MPRTVLSKIFLIIYTGFGIPLTLVFLINLSYLTRRMIEYISLIIFYVYSSNYFLLIRRLFCCRFIENKFNISIDSEEEDDSEDEIMGEEPKYIKQSSKIQRHIHRFLKHLKNVDNDKDLTLKQLLLALFIYILIGTYFISSNSFSDKFYLCFTTLFTINVNTITNQEKNLFFLTIYLIFGLAIVWLFVQTLKNRLETLLINIGKILLQYLLEFSQQISKTHEDCVNNVFF